VEVSADPSPVFQQTAQAFFRGFERYRQLASGRRGEFGKAIALAAVPRSFPLSGLMPTAKGGGLSKPIDDVEPLSFIHCVNPPFRSTNPAQGNETLCVVYPN
jgi:hypothetical protein